MTNAVKKICNGWTEYKISNKSVVAPETANHIGYDNTTSEIQSTNVQDAIDEVVSMIEWGWVVTKAIQVSELPDATEDELWNIYQYVWSTTETETNGYFYKCVVDGPTSFKRENIEVQPGGGEQPEASDIIYVTQEEYDNLPDEEKLDETKNYVIYEEWAIVDIVVKAVNVTYDNSNTHLTSHDIQWAIDELNEKVESKWNSTIIVSDVEPEEKIEWTWWFDTTTNTLKIWDWTTRQEIEWGVPTEWEDIIYITADDYAALPAEEKEDESKHYVIYAAGSIDPSWWSTDAIEISYDNTDSWLESTNVQKAIDEVVDKIDDIKTNLSDLEDVGLNDIEDWQILVYNASEWKWENRDFNPTGWEDVIYITAEDYMALPESEKEDESKHYVIYAAGSIDPSGGSTDAIEINYDNTDSWLESTNVQKAIDEVVDKMDDIKTNLSDLEDTNIDNPTRWQILVYNPDNGKWENQDANLNWWEDVIYITAEEYAALSSEEKEDESKHYVIYASWSIDPSWWSTDAIEVNYDNTDSWLESTNVQKAIDEVVDKMDDIKTNLSDLEDSDINNPQNWQFLVYNSVEWKWENKTIEWMWWEDVIYITAEDYAWLPASEKEDTTKHYVIYAAWTETEYKDRLSSNLEVHTSIGQYTAWETIPAWTPLEDIIRKILW